MGQQRQKLRRMSRDEQIALLKVLGETDENIDALLAQSQLDQARVSAEVAAAGPQTAPPAKAPYRVRNWKEYNQTLVKRGSLTLWFDQDSIAAWYASKDPDKLSHPGVGTRASRPSRRRAAVSGTSGSLITYIAVTSSTFWSSAGR
ncbi:MAG: hypothetical protein OHK0015_14980 [Chloroflexi bacterium OHK40]